MSQKPHSEGHFKEGSWGAALVFGTVRLVRQFAHTARPAITLFFLLQLFLVRGPQ